jgi:ParB family chromosome partitioning protein
LSEPKKNQPKMKRKALGRGLGAILPEIRGENRGAGQDAATVPITMLQRNPNQARQNFSKESLEQLARSLREHGVLQPVIVRAQAGGMYEIVAGERRWRAAQLAGLTEIPVLVRQVSEKQAAEINLIENIQRDDLNPMEEAEALRRLLEEHGYTQEHLADRIGRSRTALTNLLRLLDLPLPVQEMVRTGKLTEGHGRALLRIEQERVRIKAAMEVAAKQLSVRETEKLAAQLSKSPSPAVTGRSRGASSPEIRELVGRLQRRLAPGSMSIMEGAETAGWRYFTKTSTSSTASWPSFSRRGSRGVQSAPGGQERLPATARLTIFFVSCSASEAGFLPGLEVVQWHTAPLRISSTRLSNESPAPAAILGSRDFSVIPGREFSSSTYSFSPSVTIRSTRVAPLQPSTLLACSASVRTHR